MWSRKFYDSSKWIAIYAALSCGIITHAFGMVNILHNYDDIAQQPKGYGTGITSGRWLLSILGDIIEKLGGNYNLPVVNGLLFLFLLALTSGCIVYFFHIRSKLFAALIGMLMVVFPTAFSTLVFRYTAVYYGFGILLSALAACSVCSKKYGLLLSGLCTAFSLGIYQAYVPITISLFVLKLIQEALEGNSSLKKLVCRGFYYCATLILGLIFYYILLKMSLAAYGTQLSNYQGMDQMGKLSLNELPKLVKEAVYSVIMLPFKDYCGVAGMGIIKIAYLILGGISVVLTVYILIAKIRRWDIAFFAICMFILLTIAVNFIVIMCPDSWIYTLMVYAFVVLPCVPLVIYECIPVCRPAGKHWLKKGIGIVTAILISCYAYQTNINYSALYYSNRQVENYLSSLVTQIRMSEGFHTQLKWAFIGEIDDPLLHCYWQYEMNYGGIEFTEWMLRRYSLGDWIQNYYGYTYQLADEQITNWLAGIDEVKEMPCWPNEGSIKVIENYIVVKFQELEEE